MNSASGIQGSGPPRWRWRTAFVIIASSAILAPPVGGGLFFVVSAPFWLAVVHGQPLSLHLISGELHMFAIVVFAGGYMLGGIPAFAAGLTYAVADCFAPPGLPRRLLAAFIGGVTACGASIIAAPTVSIYGFACGAAAGWVCARLADWTGVSMQPETANAPALVAQTLEEN
jgi:hypothetical protein